jgi:hypothetical protein
LFALINPDVSCGGSLVDYFLFLHYAAFDDYYRVNMDYYRVNKDCARIRNQASAGEAVSLTISKAAATPFSVMITESTGIVRTDKSRHQLGKKFW